MKIVIAGCSRVGALLARKLDSEGHQVIIIDNDPTSFRRLEFYLDFPVFKGTALKGNAVNEDVLKRAGIEDTDVFFALTQGDNRNILASQIAKHIFNIPRVICKINDPLRQELFSTLGLETMSPTTVLTQVLKDKLERLDSKCT